MLALFTVNILTLVHSRYSIVAYWVAGWMSGNPAQELHQPHLCGCWSPRTPRYSLNTSRSWRRRAFETTSSSSTSCWTSSWTSATPRPQTARSCRSEWVAWGPGTGLSGGQARRCHCVEVMRRFGGAGGRCAFLLLVPCLSPAHQKFSKFLEQLWLLSHSASLPGVSTLAVARSSFPSTEVRSVPCF